MRPHDSSSCGEIDTVIKVPADTLEIPISGTDRSEGTVWIHAHQLQKVNNLAAAMHITGQNNEFCIVSIVPLGVEEFVVY
jgi:hypothetical protein